MTVQLGLSRLSAWGATHGLQLKLRPPVTEAALAEAATALGQPLPTDYVELLQIADGQENAPDFPWLLGCDRLAPLKSVLRQLAEERQLATEYPPPDRLDLDGHIHAGRFHANRLPIAGTPWFDGDTTYIDLEPGPAGTLGQVVTLVTECDFVVMGAGLGAAINRWADALEAGRFVWDTDRRTIVPAGGNDFDDHPAIAICTAG